MKKLMNKTFVMTAMALAIAGCDDTDTLPDKNGNSFGQIALEGTAIVGETMSVTVTDGNGVDESAITYSWMADGLAIEGATSSTYVITAAEAGAAISVTAAYTDNDNFSEVLTSNETSSVLMNIKGVVTISGILASGKLLTAEVADENDIGADGIVFAWFAVGEAIEGADEATLALTDVLVGKVITVTATYTDGENFSEAIVSEATAAVDVAGENVPATFMNLAATTSKNVGDQISGTIDVADGDVGENTIMPQTNVSTMYGTFSIDSAGNWTYTLNTAAAAVAALADASDTINDTISIQSADGTMANFVITIAGLDAVEARKVAKIVDTITSDAGELRYKFDDGALPKGKLTVSFMKEDNAIGFEDDSPKDAYIGLYGESTSTSNAIVDLRIQSDKFVIRNMDSDLVTIPFVPDVWTDVEMTWDSTNGADVNPLVTITINGESVTTEAFVSVSNSTSDVTTGLRYAIFKFGDDSRSIPDAAYYIDDIKIYSDLEGNTVAFEDDFESYEVGYNLDRQENEASVYHNNTSEAVVYLFEAVDPVEPGNTAATFANLTASAMNDIAGDLTGNVGVADVDVGEDSVTAQTDTVTLYGTFSIDANGDWTYTLDKDNVAVMALVSVSDSVTDSIAVTSADGTMANLEITITGTGAAVNTPAEFAGLMASVANNADSDLTGKITVTDVDAGEAVIGVQTDVMTTFGTFSIDVDGNWTYTLDTANATVSSLVDAMDTVVDTISVASADGTTADLEITISGVTVIAASQVAKISDSDGGDTGELYYAFDSGLNEGQFAVSILYGETETETAYISLYDSAGSTSSLIGELQLNEGKFSLRSNNGGNAPLDAPDFTPGTWIDVVLTWNTTSDVEQGTYTVSIDGVSYGEFKSENSTPGVLVEHVTVRLASNSKMSADAIYLDNYNVYSDEAGTMALIEEDFEGFAIDESLLDDNVNSPFGSRTFEAVVVSYGTPVEDENQVAQISDNMTSDAGELRYKFEDGDIVKGSMTVSFYKEGPAIGIQDGKDPVAKDAYIAIYGDSTSSSNAIVDLRIQDDNFALRGQDGIDVAIAFEPNTWTDVEITWDASAATDLVPPTVTVSINGTSVTVDAFESASSALDKVKTGVKYVMFKLGDNSSTIPDAKFFVDDVKVYTDGVADPVFEDDFEGYTVGDSLDTDNVASPYHSNTAEAVVATKE